MLLKQWDDLPQNMKTEEVRKYYDILSKKKVSLFLKRLFDIIVSAIMIIVLCIPMLVIAIIIKCDSKGPVIFRQERVTQYGRHFFIHKFRTMVTDAETTGSLITTSSDSRVTKAGATLRKYKLDEIPQLIDIFVGDMSYVGTRPEVAKYVDHYSPEMMATLLLPAGTTSIASIAYKDENDLIAKADNVDEVYIKEILPDKMKYNLEGIEEYSMYSELWIMMKTVLAVIK